jgi:hypothetical protein
VTTFVVRLWTPTEPLPGERDALRGVVEHVGSGRATPFGSDDELLDLLRAGAQVYADSIGSPSATRPGSST